MQNREGFDYYKETMPALDAKARADLVAFARTGGPTLTILKPAACGKTTASGRLVEFAALAPALLAREAAFDEGNSGAGLVERGTMTPIERVRCELALSEAGYRFEPLAEDVAELLAAYDAIVNRTVAT